MGGLIIRSSLNYLNKYIETIHGLVTINTPHLGSSSDNFLVNTGMRILCN